MITTRNSALATPAGTFFEEGGIEWYRIDGVDLLDPFLVNVVAPSDQWMFVSSSGALTAGRRSARHALFPYETDDRLHRSGGRSGPITIVRVGPEIWEPFAGSTPIGSVRRSIAKTAAGDRLRFEEHHPRFGLTFRYTWSAADRFGFIRTCELSAVGSAGAVDLEILDGLLDILPAGVDLSTQQTSSTLVDAYRRSEVDETSGVAVFTLEALVSDRPQPAESLRATLVWSTGLDGATVTLSDREVAGFRSGRRLDPERLVLGRKGAYLLSAPLTVRSGSTVRWSIVADVERDHGDFAALRTWLGTVDAPEAELAAALEGSHRFLIDLVGRADGRQETADRPASIHHFANVLFNVMRGGVFLDDHRVRVAAVRDFIAARNSTAGPRFSAVAATLDDVVEIGELRDAVAGDPDLQRLVDEYLPLSFSRRHGDPSRPWNTFQILLGGPSGELGTGYEGNWRDIFQNWDALLHSFPEYMESVTAKFLNASTVDGFNPYRITDAGIDWELPEKGEWANLGYWGDHQIAYLHRLLDAERRFHPGALESRLDRVCFSYADVPYRIRSYHQIVDDPKHTIDFDDERQLEIERRVRALGADGRLVPDREGMGVHHASLAEKLIIPALAKISNLVAGAGIWMNTQRPEWNDANNALVGNGVSTVTLFHLRHYVAFLDDLLAGAGFGAVPIGSRVVEWMRALAAAFDAHTHLLDGEITDAGRRSLLDALGTAFADYRTAAYDAGPGSPEPVAVEELRRFLTLSGRFLEAGAAGTTRPDGLFESYVLLHLEPGEARVAPLYEMLEGQVAALADPSMSPEKALDLVDTLFAGPLYRADQHSFVLYPDRALPPFWEKNVVPEEAIGPAATALLEAGSPILSRDAEGLVRFDASFRSARQLAAAFDTDAPGLDTAGRREILGLYEEVFRHSAFTGRSGTMYRYEGLGSIYWHMVSKLLFALQERVVEARREGAPPDLVLALAERYRRVRSGLGFQKTVAEQGTFPTDPHSHTPREAGAQQPGMTGQVKEGVLLRWGELGVRVHGGRVSFSPVLLSADEFLIEPRPWPPLGSDGRLEAGTLGFTYCGVPVVYHATDGASWTRVRWRSGEETLGGESLDEHASEALFSRRGLIERIDVGVASSALLGAAGPEASVPG
jgi:hypothetical protein